MAHRGCISLAEWVIIDLMTTASKNPTATSAREILQSLQAAQKSLIEAQKELRKATELIEEHENEPSIKNQPLGDVRGGLSLINAAVVAQTDAWDRNHRARKWG